MNKTFALGTMLLSCCLFAVGQDYGQQSSTPSSTSQNQAGQSQTGQSQTGQSQTGQGQTGQGQSSSMSDTSSSGQMASESRKSIQGCLSQSADGNYMLADESGNNFQLKGDTSKLSSYIGKEVRLRGSAMAGSEGSATSMSGSSSASTSTPQMQFNVSDVHKVSDTCQTGSK